MKTRGNGWVRGGSVAALVAGAVWLGGCGGAGGPTWSGSGPSYGSSGTTGSSRSSSSTGGANTAPQPAGSVRGVVEMPARPTGYARPVALLERLGVVSPAQAEARLVRAPVTGARVHLIDRATRQPVSPTVVTDGKGEFRIENVTPSNRFSVLAAEGKVTLEAVVAAPDSARSEVRVVVNEASTVGAAAARVAEAEGLGPEAGVQLAQQIAELQQTYQSEHPAEMPDLTRAEQAEERARQHFLRTADAAVEAALNTGDRAEAWRAVASAQLLARTNFKLSRKVIFTPLQVEAIVAAMIGKETRTLAADKIVSALQKAGVKTRDGKAIAAGHVSAALNALRKPLPSLKDVKPEQVPVVVAVLLAEQADAPFQISTREQMTRYLKELVGQVSETTPAKAKPGSTTASQEKKPPAAGDEPKATTPAPSGEPKATTPVGGAGKTA